MTDMILIYVPCNSEEEARTIGDHIMKQRLAPCYNTLPHHSACFWPPKTGTVETADGAVLLIKTLEKNYDAIEQEVKTLHSDKNPCIFAIPVVRVSGEYLSWLTGETG